MKRIITTIAFVFGVLLSLSAQGPTEKWPYLYLDFENGVVRMQDGTLLIERPLNVCVSDGSLHYVDKGKILVAKMNKVFSAKIGGDVFVCALGKMMKVLAEQDEAAVLELFEVDLDKFNSSDIGYGISSRTASTTQVSNLASTAGVVNKDLYDVLGQRGDGADLPLKRTLLLLHNGKVTVANRSSVLKIDGIDKDAANKFFKENKIKWNKTDSLLKLAVYLKENE